MAKFTDMDHVQNIETLCQRLDILSDHYLDKRTYNSRENRNPKDLIFIWYTGESFGLTPFQSYFIGYTKTDITVMDVTKINRVIGIGTTLHKFQNDQGKDIFLPCVLYHIYTTYVRLFSPQTYQKMHGGYS